MNVLLIQVVENLFLQLFIIFSITSRLKIHILGEKHKHVNRTTFIYVALCNNSIYSIRFYLIFESSYESSLMSIQENLTLQHNTAIE